MEDSPLKVCPLCSGSVVGRSYVELDSARGIEVRSPCKFIPSSVCRTSINKQSLVAAFAAEVIPVLVEHKSRQPHGSINSKAKTLGSHRKFMVKREPDFVTDSSSSDDDRAFGPGLVHIPQRLILQRAAKSYGGDYDSDSNSHQDIEEEMSSINKLTSCQRFSLKKLFLLKTKVSYPSQLL